MTTPVPDRSSAQDNTKPPWSGQFQGAPVSLCRGLPLVEAQDFRIIACEDQQVTSACRFHADATAEFSPTIALLSVTANASSSSATSVIEAYPSVLLITRARW